MGSTRRTYLTFLISAAFAITMMAPPFAAQAKDGGGDSDGGSGGSSGGGDSSHSGRGGGDDDGGDDHGGHGKDDNGSGGAAGSSDYDRARDAVRDGQIMPLKSMLKKIDAARYGRVIDIRLSRSLSRDIYQLKLRDDRGVIRILRVDARSGALIGSN